MSLFLSLCVLQVFWQQKNLLNRVVDSNDSNQLLICNITATAIFIGPQWINVCNFLNCYENWRNRNNFPRHIFVSYILSHMWQHIWHIYDSNVFKTQEETFAATNFTTKFIYDWAKWLSAIAWLARGLADERLRSLIFLTPACARRKWSALCVSLLSNYSLPFS